MLVVAQLAVRNGLVLGVGDMRCFLDIRISNYIHLELKFQNTHLGTYRR